MKVPEATVTKSGPEYKLNLWALLFPIFKVQHKQGLSDFLELQHGESTDLNKNIS